MRRRGQPTKSCRDLQWRKTRVGYAEHEGMSVGERKRFGGSARRGEKGQRLGRGAFFIFEMKGEEGICA